MNMNKKIFDDKLICELYVSGSSMMKIEKLVKCSQTSVSKILRENGIQIRPKHFWDRKNKKLHTLDFKYFKEINSKDKAYWLGYITADGTISKNGYKVSIASKDLEILQKFKKSINTTHPISLVESFDKRTNKIYTRYMIQINSMEFVYHLVKCGITNRKSYECDIPKMDEIFIPSYLRGLFDGDGGLQKNSEKNIRITFSATLEILKSIQSFLLKYDIENHPIYRVSNNCNMYKTTYNKDAMKILNIIYEDSSYEIRLNRKYDTYRSMKEHNISPLF